MNATRVSLSVVAVDTVSVNVPALALESWGYASPKTREKVSVAQLWPVVRPSQQKQTDRNAWKCTPTSQCHHALTCKTFFLNVPNLVKTKTVRLPYDVQYIIKHCLSSQNQVIIRAELAHVYKSAILKVIITVQLRILNAWQKKIIVWQLFCASYKMVAFS